MKKRPENRRGATAVEFALVAPVFFLIVFGMFEFSRLNVIRHTADNAAYEAARLAIVPGATAEQAIAEANRVMSIIGTRGVEVRVNPARLGIDTQQVTVTVEAPVAGNSWVIPQFTGAARLRSEATLRTERVQTRNL